MTKEHPCHRLSHLENFKTISLSATENAQDILRKLKDRLKSEFTDLEIVQHSNTTILVTSSLQELTNLQEDTHSFYICKGENFHFQLWSSPPRELDITLLGHRLNLETVNACNASCSMCPVENLQRKKEIMNIDISFSVLDSVRNIPEIQTINMYMNGEPLLDRSLENRISHASSIGLPYLRISTNGHLLSLERYKALSQAGLDEITISLDSPIAKQHEKIRPGVSFERIIKNIKQIINYKNSTKKHHASIMIGMIVGNENKPFINEMCQLVANLFECVTPEFKQYGILIEDHYRGLGFFITKRFDWVGNYRDKPESLITKGSCPGYSDIIVYPDGRVPFCCLDSHGENIIGNVKSTNIIDIINSKKRKDMITSLVKRDIKNIPKTCKNCSLLYENRELR